MYFLPETELMKIETSSETDRTGTYVIEPLSPGYGITLGNSLRRVLFASLTGSAITSVKIDGATHEFTSVNGMKEDVVALMLNLKTLRIKLLSDEPAVLRLDVKGPGEIRAKNFASNPNVEVIDPEHYICTLDKAGKLSLEVTVERGRGYVPTEQRQAEGSAPLGTIHVDAIFTPVKKVHYDVVNTRVGNMTNFDKLTITVSTDGTIHPREAIGQAAQILVDHFGIVAALQGTVEEATPAKKTSKKSKKAEEVIETIGTMGSEETIIDEVVEKPAKAKKAKTSK